MLIVYLLCTSAAVSRRVSCLSVGAMFSRCFQDQKVTRDLAYVFPPGEFVESFIKEISFELYARIKSKQAPSFNYLFVIVVPADELHNSVATTAAANTST